jgi:uncharacterized protein YndB with AHSA1/START domain
MISKLEFEISLPVEIDTIWQEWTDQTKIIKWFSPEANIEPINGGAYELFFDPSNHNHMSTKGCKIIEIKPPTYIAFQWKGPDQYAHFMNTPPQTHVEIRFTQDDSGTTMHIKHQGWKQGKYWQEAKEWHHKAWKGVINDLQKHLS